MPSTENSRHFSSSSRAASISSRSSILRWSFGASSSVTGGSDVAALAPLGRRLRGVRVVERQRRRRRRRRRRIDGRLAARGRARRRRLVVVLVLVVVQRQIARARRLERRRGVGGLASRSRARARAPAFFTCFSTICWRSRSRRRSSRHSRQWLSSPRLAAHALGDRAEGLAERELRRENHRERQQRRAAESRRRCGSGTRDRPGRRPFAQHAAGPERPQARVEHARRRARRSPATQITTRPAPMSFVYARLDVDAPEVCQPTKPSTTGSRNAA